MNGNRISLNPSAIVRILAAISFLIVLGSIAGQLIKYFTGHDHIYGLVPLLDLDEEKNFPTFLSSFLLLVAFLLLLIISALERIRKGNYVLHWIILSGGFLFMACDEFISLHERLMKPVRKLLGPGNHGVLYFSWVIPASILVFVLAVFFMKFLLRLPRKTKWIFFMAAALYLGGCIGVEMVDGRYAELHGLNNLTYALMTNLEESLEIAGVILFLWGLLGYITSKYKEIDFRVG